MKNINQIAPDFKRFLKKLQSPSVMKRGAKEAARLIKLRTRTAGKDVGDAPLRELKESTIKAKIRLKRKLPRKSRLTDTGKMLDDITSRGKFARGFVFFRSRKMAERAKFNEERARVFFGLSRKDESKLTSFFREIYRKITGQE